MKHLTKAMLLAASAILLASASSAQIFDKTKGKNAQALYNQQVTVYTEGQGSYTQRLTNAFNSYWKVTPFQFRDISRGLPAMEEGSTIFMPIVIGLSKRDHATSMNYPFFIMAEAYQSGRPNAEGIVAAFPINGFHYEMDVTSDSNMYNRCLLRLPYIVRTLNDMISHLKTGGKEDGFFKNLEVKSATIGSKTLLIPSELLTQWDVNPNTTALMKADLAAGKKPMKPIMAAVLEQAEINYAGKYKIMPTADILKLEESDDAGKYALFLPAIDDKKYLMVFDLKTKELLYFESIKMSMKIKEKDFEKISEAAGLK